MSDQLSPELIVNEGTCVYSLSWNTGAPGGTGSERVYVLDGHYAVALDSGEVDGLHTSLAEAVKNHEQLSWIGPATTEVSSTELTADEVMALLVSCRNIQEPSQTMIINGISCTLEP